MMEGSPGRSGGGGIRRLGEFVLLDELGRGGMGVVFRARQETLGRIVAVKVLPSFAGLDRDAVARFRREAETAARIAHPGIVPVFAVGEDQGTYYYAMELVDGPPLESMLGELEGRNPSRLLGTLAEETTLGERCPAYGRGHWPGAPMGARYAVSCAAIAADLANALCVAHRANVIHRDLKPSNVLLSSSGRPMIVDFGLSRDQTAVGLTQSGDAVGTPSYMAPEQAYGLKDLDARVDVYGLGATLYEMLTLQPPFDGAHAAEIMRRIIEDEPAPVRALNSRVPQDLAAIVHKCLAKNRDLRYPAMEAVDLDLRAFLEGRATQAQAPSVARRLVSFGLRHRRGIGVAAATTTVLSLGGVVMGVWSGSRMREAGMEQLTLARDELVMHGNLETAQECYGRANQLLADPATVGTARQQHLQAAFDAWYAQADRRPWLMRLLNSIPPELRTPRWAALERRLRGEAQCRLEGYLLDAGTDVSLTRFDGERFVPVEGGWPEDGMLATGHYVARLERPGLAPTALAFTVGRDVAQTVVAPQLSVAAVHEDEVLVASDEPARAFLLARTEMSGKEFEALTGGLPPEQRAEFADVEVGEEHLPVSNLSLRQARTLAALAGGHLPSLAEYQLAGRAGAPAATMRYPWGGTFDDSRVHADPVRSSRPGPVDSRPSGASPFGILHLVGNVAEFVGAGGGDSVWLAGGDFLSGRDQATLDAHTVVLDLDQPQRRGGVRVARVAPVGAEANAAAAAAAETRFESLWKDGSVVLMQDWDIDANGAARSRLRLAGFHREGVRRLGVPVATPGFLQNDVPECRLGGGPPERVVPETRGGETILNIDVDKLVARQLYRIDVTCALTPVTGLLGRADGYVLQVPLKATGRTPNYYRVTLPPRSTIDEVDPPPTAFYAVKDRPVLTWEFPPDGGGDRAFSGVVRFRKDGFLSARWPTKAEAMRVAGRLFTALRARDTATLRDMLDPSFVMAPSGATAAILTDGRGTVREWFDNVRFVDVTAVGAVNTAELVVDWHAGDKTAKGWPLRVHWRNDGNRARVLEVSPAGRSDTGRIEQGAYVHDAVLLRIDSGADFTLSRMVGHLAPLQVELRPNPLDRPCFVMVLGRYEDKDTDEAAVWQVLSGGTHVVDGNQRSLGQRPGKFADYPAVIEDWVFAAGPGYRRERWLKVSSGRRRLLIRMVALGDSADLASRAFERAETWFDGLLPRLHLD
ncbi:MAG: bifunctional serine/threonine-protein kinase/formylglycine-generating enzyme family protein [Planctomycetota bacterium]